MASTIAERRAFVEYVKESAELVLLDFTRDGLHTVAAACRDRRAYEDADVVSAGVEYTVSMVWTSALGHYYVVFTTERGGNPFPASSGPPEYWIENAEDTFESEGSPLELVSPNER